MSIRLAHSFPQFSFPLSLSSSLSLYIIISLFPILSLSSSCFSSFSLDMSFPFFILVFHCSFLAPIAIPLVYLSFLLLSLSVTIYVYKMCTKCIYFIYNFFFHNLFVLILGCLFFSPCFLFFFLRSRILYLSFIMAIIIETPCIMYNSFRLVSRFIISSI